MTQVLSKNIIDLTQSANTAQALSRFEELLNSETFANAPLSVVLGNMVFTQGHIARLKALASEKNSKIEVIYASAAQTQLAALNANLTVSEKAPGDCILEEFKNSLNTINEPALETNKEPQCACIQFESTDNTTNKTEEEQILILSEEQFETENTLNSAEETLKPEAIFTESSEFKTLNDVIEILNTDNNMVQDKIELPFEKKVDITESFIKPENIQTEEEGKERVMTTLYINQTLRSGQIVTHNGNVVIAGDTHPGSEIVAGGDIIVWGTLGGIAHAGAGRNYKASIRALRMDAIQLRIADYIARKPDKKT